VQTEHTTDVLIIGASMAGSCLARQLKLAHPQLSITVLEKKREFDHGIGESMLEIFWDYAAKDLQLAHYLDANHFFKHGIRFFFDNERKDAPVREMSELGRSWYHAIPAHQINRKTFDQDMARMNRELGVDVVLGSAVTGIALDGDGGHVVQAGGVSYRCRWLVDAAGMAAPLGRQLGDVRKIDGHPVSSAWARVKGINLVDALGPDAWRARVNYINRSLATVQFMYEGYWFWVIPVDEDTFSIGVVWHHDKSQVAIRGEAEFFDFMKSHQCLRELLGERYEVLDFGARKNMARIADRFFSGEQRWFRTGMAAAFVDPLFSSGSAFLADTNRMIGDLIRLDLEGDQAGFARKCVKYDAYMHWWVDNFLLHITGNYHGCYDVQKVFFKILLMDYFGIVFPTSVGRFWESVDFGVDDEAALKAKLRHMVQHGAMRKAHAIKDELYRFLQTRKRLLRNNLGRFHDVELGAAHMKNGLMRGKGISLQQIDEVQRNMLVAIYEDAMAVMLEHLGQPCCGNFVHQLAVRFADGELASLADGLAVIRCQEYEVRRLPEVEHAY
jgi:flavin-dependent dehydrogenase